MGRMLGNQTNRPTTISNLTPTESEVMAAVRAWLLSYMPEYTIIQGQQNNVPTPQSPFGIFQILSRKRVSTNAHNYSRDAETLDIVENLNVAIQFSAFGSNAGNDIFQIQALWRDGVSCDWFQENFPYAMPTYADEPVQHAFITAEKQYENSWTCDLHLNVNKTITMESKSAKELHLNLLQSADQLHSTNTIIQ